MENRIHYMGVINVTPDSTWGKTNLGTFLKDARKLILQGADIIDIGAVSTRPGAKPVGVQTEWIRLEPVLRIAAAELKGVRFSVDTTSAAIVRRAHSIIKDIIVNDISAGEDDPRMLDTVRELGLTYIAMHKRGNPQTMDTLCDYSEYATLLSPSGVIPALTDYFDKFAMKAQGIDWILDPGLGFAKTKEQCMEILDNLSEFQYLGRPIMVSISEKRFTENNTLELNRRAIENGATFIRFHAGKEYIPDLDQKYPQDPFQRLAHVEVPDSSKGKYQFDEYYPYLDDSLKYKANQALNTILLWGFFAMYNIICRGIRIKGRANLKDKRLKNGAISICNHCLWTDAVCVYQAVRPLGRLWIPMYSKHFNGRWGWLLRYMGGIPVAETLGGSRKFYEAFDELHNRKQWFQIFPEEVRWENYQPIRPFRKGAFAMAYKYDMPIVPCVITYRKRHGIYLLTGPKNSPLLTIQVGEPIFPDQTKTRKHEIDRLRTESHAVMESMTGLSIAPWPAIADGD